MIVFRPATLEDAVWLSSRLRSEDVREVETATGKHPEAIVPLSFQLSQECFAIRRVIDGKVAADPVAICGVNDSATDIELGAVWFLASDEVRYCALSLLLESPLWLNHMSRRYPKGLYNYADSRNTLHVRWCQLTGFSIGEAVNVNGIAFHTIHRPTPPCALIQQPPTRSQVPQSVLAAQ